MTQTLPNIRLTERAMYALAENRCKQHQLLALYWSSMALSSLPCAEGTLIVFQQLSECLAAVICPLTRCITLLGTTDTSSALIFLKID